jgi:hypothetical protein
MMVGDAKSFLASRVFELFVEQIRYLEFEVSSQPLKSLS